jgi:hypothetical protein
MTQKEVDLVFEITAMLQTPWFAEKSLEEIQEWVAKQLKEYGIETIPCGASWGVLTNKKPKDDR